MKKIILLTVLIVLMFGADDVKLKNIYLDYTNKIINYEFELKDINKIKTPFYKPYTPDLNMTKNISHNQASVKKSIKLTLLSIFGNRAHIKIDTYLGEQLIKSEKKWIQLNDKIYGCRLVNLTQTDAYFRCGKKTLHKTLNKTIPSLRDKQ